MQVIYFLNINLIMKYLSGVIIIIFYCFTLFSVRFSDHLVIVFVGFFIYRLSAKKNVLKLLNTPYNIKRQIEQHSRKANLVFQFFICFCLILVSQKI